MQCFKALALEEALAASGQRCEAKQRSTSGESGPPQGALGCALPQLCRLFLTHKGREKRGARGREGGGRIGWMLGRRGTKFFKNFLRASERRLEGARAAR